MPEPPIRTGAGPRTGASPPPARRSPRAHAVAGDRAESDRWAARAREAYATIADPADREVIMRGLATIPR